MNASGAAKDPRDNGSPFGVLAFLAWNHDWNHYHFPDEASIVRSAKLMKGAGIGFVRIDFLWSDLEPEKGRFDFARMDFIVNTLRENGISILGIPEYNPSWRGVPWNQAPDPDDYEAYVRAVVRHFKDRVRYWEIWNEPDVDIYWTPQDGLTAYSALLKRISAVIREEDPGAKVVMGGLSSQWPENVRRIYEKAGKTSFDIVNLHPFVHPLRPEAAKRLEEIVGSVENVMAEFGDGAKPIWVTEIGCPGLPGPEAGRGWWLGGNVLEADQARWVKEVYKTLLGIPAVQKVFWAFLRDTDNHFLNDIDYFGLLREDFSPKAAYQALQSVGRHKRTVF